MIVGIVSLTKRPIDIMLNTLKDDVGAIISENDLLPKLGVGNLVNNANLKYSTLSQLESQYSNVISYGNVLLDKEVCQRILNHGGQIIIAIEDNPILGYPYKGRYFKNAQKLNEVYQSKWCKDRLLKAIYWEVDREIPPNIDFSIVTSVEETTDTEPVFLKIGNGKMVLFIPQTINFERQELAGTEYTTLVVKAPALDNGNLQKLEVLE